MSSAAVPVCIAGYARPTSFRLLWSFLLHRSLSIWIADYRLAFFEVESFADSLSRYLLCPPSYEASFGVGDRNNLDVESIKVPSYGNDAGLRVGFDCPLGLWCVREDSFADVLGNSVKGAKCGLQPIGIHKPNRIVVNEPIQV